MKTAKLFHRLEGHFKDSKPCIIVVSPWNAGPGGVPNGIPMDLYHRASMVATVDKDGNIEYHKDRYFSIEKEK